MIFFIQNLILNFHHFIMAHNDIARFGEDLRNDLFPNIPTFFGNLLASVILIFIIVRYTYAPFRESQRKKHDYIKNQIASANQKYADANRKNNETNKLLKSASLQAKEIIENSRESANKIRDKIISDANNYRKKTILDTEHEIARQKEKVKKEIRNESIDLAFLIASKIIGKNIKKESMNEVIDKIIDEYDNIK